MSVLISCQCGTKLKVPPTAAGKNVSCPKCKKLVKVPAASGTGPVTTAPARPPQRPATQQPGAPQMPTVRPAADATVTLSCNCGQQMKVATAHAGKKVACPKCQSQLLVPGGTATVTPVVTPVVAPVQPVIQPVQPTPVQPSQPLPDFFSGGSAPVGGLQPYTPPAAAPAHRKRKQAGGAATKPGALIVLIGLSIMCTGFLFSTLAQACLHIAVYQASSVRRPSMSFGMSPDERRAIIESLSSRRDTMETLQKVSKVCMKIGRPVLVIGTFVAVVGYGICIMSPGVQMGLAIAALIAGAIGGILDLIMRAIPYLSENDMPRDVMTVRVSIFDHFSSITFMPLLIELLMAAHLILFSIYALISANRGKNRTPAFPITALSLFAAYIVVIFIVNVLMGSARGFSSTGTLWTAFGLHWVANICLAIGLGFLITTIVEMRRA